jgi:hypothetical protein
MYRRAVDSVCRRWGVNGDDVAIRTRSDSSLDVGYFPTSAANSDLAMLVYGDLSRRTSWLANPHPIGK